MLCNGREEQSEENEKLGNEHYDFLKRASKALFFLPFTRCFLNSWKNSALLKLYIKQISTSLQLKS